MPVARIQSAPLAGLCPSQLDIPPHWTVNIILHFLRSGFLWDSFPLQEARWDCGMPGISPGSSPDSWRSPTAKARAWTTSCWGTRRPSHCSQLWLLLRTSPQAIVPASGEEKEACSHKQGQTHSEWHTHVHTFTLGIVQKWKKKCKEHTPTCFFILLNRVNQRLHWLCPQLCVLLSLWACFSRLQTLSLSRSLFLLACFS